MKEAFQGHLRETEGHIARLEQIFQQMGMPVRGKKCEGMQHLIAEGNEMISECEDDDTRDAVMIAAAQKVEHYEIASYGTIRTWANLLGKGEIAIDPRDISGEKAPTSSHQYRESRQRGGGPRMGTRARKKAAPAAERAPAGVGAGRRGQCCRSGKRQPRSRATGDKSLGAESSSCRETTLFFLFATRLTFRTGGGGWGRHHDLASKSGP